MTRQQLMGEQSHHSTWPDGKVLIWTYYGTEWNTRRAGPVVTYALWLHLIIFCCPYILHLAAPHFEQRSVSCLQISSKWPGLIRYWSRCWTFCGWVNTWIVPHHCCSVLKASWRSCETVFGNFWLVRIAYTQCITAIPIESLCDFIYNQAVKQGNKMPLSGYHLARDPPEYLLCVWLYFFCHPAWCQFITRVCLQAYVIWGLCYVTWSAIRSSHNIQESSSVTSCFLLLPVYV